MRSTVASRALALLLGATLVAAGCGDDARSADAVLGVEIALCDRVNARRAVGAAVGPDLVVTVAHALDGAAAITLHDGGNRELAATPLLIDPAKDLALLRPERALPDWYRLGDPTPGPVGVVTRRADDGATIASGEILELVDATLDGVGRRAAARLAADIEAGDSGAAVLDRDGDLVAMVFATVRGEAQAWAVSADEIRAAMETAADGPPSQLSC